MNEYQLMRGLGQGDAFSSAVANQLVNIIKPTVLRIVEDAATAAEPTIRTVVREEVMPKVAIFGIGGMVLVGFIGALVGAYFATRR